MERLGQDSSSHRDIMPTTSIIQGAHIACITTRYPSVLGATQQTLAPAALDFVSVEWQEINYPKVEVLRLCPSLLAAYIAPTLGHWPPPSAPPPVRYPSPGAC